LNTVQNITQGGAVPSVDERDAGYWFSLIEQGAAGEFLSLNPRTLQNRRLKGGGPEFIRISSRCIKYRRIDLKEWSEGLRRKSTSDIGTAA